MTVSANLLKMLGLKAERIEDDCITIFFDNFVLHVPVEGTVVGERYEIRRETFEEDKRRFLEDGK